MAPEIRDKKLNGYKPIQGFSGYYINDVGAVLSTVKRSNQPTPRSPRQLKTYIANGYKKVGLAKDGKIYKKYIHRLVLETFVGPSPSGYQCRHLNGNPLDCRVRNLKWGTYSENQLDRHDHGTDNRGEKHGMNKYSAAFVKSVRELCKGTQQKIVAKMLGIPRSTVSAIMTRRSWKHV
jgi:hypothetical protein